MTYKAPDPGKGWRLLKLGEVIPDGKVFWFNGDWVETVCGGDIHEHVVNALIPMFYRTREGVKPVKERKPKPTRPRHSSVKPSGRLDRIKAFAKRFTPHDKQQAFLFGLVIGLCAAVFLVACDNPTSPDKPCTKQEIHHGDTVTVPCVMHGGIGDSVGVLLD